MSVFDEKEIEAGHLALASFISNCINALRISLDITRKVVLATELRCYDHVQQKDIQAVQLLANRYVNATGAATKLLDAGYFIQAFSLFRDIAETGMLFLLFHEYPEKITEWREIPNDKRHNIFGRSKISKQIKKHESKFAYFNEFFDLHSGFGTHPSSQSIAAQFDGELLHIGPHVNKSQYVKAHKDLAGLVWHVTLAAGEFWEGYTNSQIREIFPDELNTFHSALGSWEKDCLV